MPWLLAREQSRRERGGDYARASEGERGKRVMYAKEWVSCERVGSKGRELDDVDDGEGEGDDDEGEVKRDVADDERGSVSF